MIRIKRFSILQTSFTLAVAVTLLTYALAILGAIFGMPFLDLGDMYGGMLGVVLIGPLVYGVMTFFGYCIALWFLNLSSCWTGGVELDVKEGCCCKEGEGCENPDGSMKIQ